MVMNRSKAPLFAGILTAFGIVAIVWQSSRDDRDPRQATSPQPREASDSPATVAPATGAVHEGSEPLRRVTGQTGESFFQRLQAVSQVPRILSSSECQTLVEFLKEPIPENNLTIVAALKNNVMDQLENQESLSATWHETLIGLFEDSSQHPVIRDYALQHLFTWYEKTLEHNSQAAVRPEMRRVMWSALNGGETTIPGTALLGLHYLSEATESGVESVRVAHAALELLRSASAPDTVRLTALQICSRMKIPEALPAARELLNRTDDVAMRCSAISVLGDAGHAGDLKLLHHLLDSDRSPGLQPALKAAIHTLTQRING